MTPNSRTAFVLPFNSRRFALFHPLAKPCFRPFLFAATLPSVLHPPPPPTLVFVLPTIRLSSLSLSLSLVILSLLAVDKNYDRQKIGKRSGGSELFEVTNLHSCRTCSFISKNLDYRVTPKTRLLFIVRMLFHFIYIVILFDYDIVFCLRIYEIQY